MFEEIDKKKLNSLGVKTLLDLVLLIPNSFEDTTIMQTPRNGKSGVLHVKVNSLNKRVNTLHVSCLCDTWNMMISLVIFNAKPFHYATFKASKKLYVLGKVEYIYGKWQMVQPKVITNIGTITPRYKTPLKNPTIINLMKKYITKENLLRYPLTEYEAKLLYDLHVKYKNELLEGVNFENILKPVLKMVEICNYLLKLSSKKLSFPASSKLISSESEFVKSLPFSLTNDQQYAIKDIKEDLASDIATKRVIMGDVGCGKTMVIFASAMMAYPKKSILMVPTTILAVQIFNEAQKYLKIKTCLVTSNEKDLNLDEYDFIIGTHALLYKNLPKSDLVMIDEQHRFGTKQRKLIHSLVSSGKTHPHFLQFSATPIPRTFAMINSSVIKYSFIKELPFKKDIDTKIIKKENFKELLLHVENEIEKNHQIIIIYPLVEKSDVNEYQSLQEARGFWEKKYKNVYVTHGKDKEKEEILQEFREHGDILLATTVVEVGISLPRLTTIVIVGAERLGFASLHQLRGRVSRTGLKGYCYLFSYSKNLQRLEEFASTSNGFEIAELDLKYRQSGDLLNGLVQHGEQFKYFDIRRDVQVLKNAKKRLNL